MTDPTISADADSAEFRAGDATGYRLAEIVLERMHVLDDKAAICLAARTVREACETAAVALGFPEADTMVLSALAAVLILDPKGEM